MDIGSEEEYEKAVAEFKALDAITPEEGPVPARYWELDEAIEDWQDARLVENLENDPEFQELLKQFDKLA